MEKAISPCASIQSIYLPVKSNSKRLLRVDTNPKRDRSKIYRGEYSSKNDKTIFPNTDFQI